MDWYFLTFYSFWFAPAPSFYFLDLKYWPSAQSLYVSRFIQAMIIFPIVSYSSLEMGFPLVLGLLGMLRDSISQSIFIIPIASPSLLNKEQKQLTFLESYKFWIYDLCLEIDCNIFLFSFILSPLYFHSLLLYYDLLLNLIYYLFSVIFVLKII